jgi:hypothetical protein
MAKRFNIRIAPRGRWEKLIRDLTNINRVLEGEKTDTALKDLAESGKDFIVRGIEDGREAWKALEDITTRIKGSSKPLVDSGDFVGAMDVWKEGRRWYGGLPAGAKGSKGQDLNTVGAVHEYGATIPVSDGMRSWFAAQGFPLRDETTHITVPPRAWFKPAFEELKEYADEVLRPLIDEILEGIG